MSLKNSNLNCDQLLANIICLVVLQMGALLVCLVATLSAVAAADQPICSQLTHYTMYDPDISDVPVTCKVCPKCPPGEGVPVQCGSKVPYGTNTDCVSCEANKTYSDSYDSSHCKSCNMCEEKIVVQECTAKRNRECGGCPPGYYLDPHLDTCKECFFCCNDVPENHRLQICKNLGMPANLQCEVTDRNKKCKMQTLLVDRTTTVKPVTKRTTKSTTGSTSTTVSVGAIAMATSTANNDPSKLKPIPTFGTQVISGSNGLPKVGRTLRGVIGGGLGFLIAVCIMILAGIKCKQSKQRQRQSTKVDYNKVEQGTFAFLFLNLLLGLFKYLGYLEKFLVTSKPLRVKDLSKDVLRYLIPGLRSVLLDFFVFMSPFLTPGGAGI